MMVIRAVVFDIGGVLLTLGETEYRQAVAKKLGLLELPAEYQAAMPALQRGEVDEATVFAAIAGGPVDLRRFDEDWLAWFRPHAAMLELAAELRARGIRTAVLSNTQPSHVRIMRAMGFLDGFDPVVMSCEAGARKPEPAAFRFVLERLGLPPEAVAHVDDIAENVAGAVALGIQGILHQGDVAVLRRRLMQDTPSD